LSASDKTWPDPGPKSELAWLPVDGLKIDPAYQRDIRSKRSQTVIRTIAEGFAWARFGVVVCVPDGDGGGADQTWHIIDGQHRVEACRLRGDIGQVPAVVLHGMTPAAAALTFVGINRDRAGMSPLQIHKALLAAGDAEARAIEDAAVSAGIQIMRYPVKAADMKPLQTLALGALRWVHTTYPSGFLARVCVLLKHAYPSEPGAIRAAVIRGVAIALYSGVPRGEILKHLKSQTSMELTRDADRRRGLGEPTYAAIASALKGEAVSPPPAPQPPVPAPAPVPGQGRPVSKAPGAVPSEDLRAARTGLEAMGFEIEVVGGGRFRIGVETYDAPGLVQFHARMVAGAKGGQGVADGG
jgi:hypothetical protein